jgi:hypothetical protein
MRDDETPEQRRCRVLAEACDTLERVKDIEQRRDDPLPSLRDRGAEWRHRAAERAADCAAAKEELQLPSVLEMLEQRLEQERAAIFEAIESALAQALAKERDFFLEEIARLRAERDGKHYAELSQIAKTWQSLIQEAHETLVELRREKLAEITASERPATAKLN